MRFVGVVPVPWQHFVNVADLSIQVFCDKTFVRWPKSRVALSIRSLWGCGAERYLCITLLLCRFPSEQRYVNQECTLRSTAC